MFFLGCCRCVTQAIGTRGNPNVVITITGQEHISCKGNIFGEALWYPGRGESGIIRIKNNWVPVDISRMGLNVDLERYEKGFGKDEVFQSFLKNMKLTIQQGKLLEFDRNIVKEKSLSELLYDQGGVELGDTGFKVGAGDSIDLKYTLLMDKASGNELENLSASVDFVIDIGEQAKE